MILLYIINFTFRYIINFTFQILGYEFAGIFMKILVYNPYMWYPNNLAVVSYMM